MKEERKSEEEVFHCPCGNCSLKSYYDEGCPKSCSGAFPYLDLCNLDECHKKDLKQQLRQDFYNIRDSFAEVFDETCASIAMRGVPVHRLAIRALSLGAYESPDVLKPLLEDEMQKLMSSKSIFEAFGVLAFHMSFFNFKLLKHITNSTQICTDDDRKRMEDYCTKFKEFCRRKVFEVSPSAVGQTIATLKKHKWKAFVVLMTKHEVEPKLVCVNVATEKIATLLDLKSSTLHLQRIDEGSLILLFFVPDFVCKKLFPLKPSVKAMLKAEGFIVLPPNKSEPHQRSTCTPYTPPFK